MIEPLVPGSSDSCGSVIHCMCLHGCASSRESQRIVLIVMPIAMNVDLIWQCGCVAMTFAWRDTLTGNSWCGAEFCRAFSTAKRWSRPESASKTCWRCTYSHAAAAGRTCEGILRISHIYYWMVHVIQQFQPRREKTRIMPPVTDVQLFHFIHFIEAAGILPLSTNGYGW